MVSGIVNESGIPRGALHSDWPYNQKGAAHVLAPYPDALMHIVTMWMLTDFTPENGGTIVSAGEPQKAVSPLGRCADWPLARRDSIDRQGGRRGGVRCQAMARRGGESNQRRSSRGVSPLRALVAQPRHASPGDGGSSRYRRGQRRERLGGSGLVSGSL